ncbi:MAG: acetylxylan esterase [Ignavibacteria bacterium]|jgi:cephalosporin-C deacetylase-like acetyl esterase
MKKVFLLVVLQLFLLSSLFAQNLLSPIWKISFIDTSEANVKQIAPTNWKDVNLLLSWKRQGYFWLDGNGCIANEFFVPAELAGSKFILSVGLQCDVKSIYVNGKFIGRNLPNQFWANRGATTEFIFPDGYLLIGQPNRIAIFISNLSYTGGISCNVCSIVPKGSELNSEVKIVIPAKDHLYSIHDANSFSIKYNSVQKGKIKLSIVNDFHQLFIQNEYEVEKGEGNIQFHFDDVITKPGFYECVAIMNDGGYSSDVRWFTLSPEKIECTNNTVPRFKEYWDETLAELKQVKPEFKLIKMDSLCTDNRDAYIAEMKSFGGLAIRGYYFVPKTPGKHAAVLHVPGYGNGYQDRRVFLSNRDDVIELALCVRGHGISADVFNPGFDVPGIWGYKLCSETENAYRGIYMDCVRAVEFLLSRPEVDTSRIGVMGGSQGGGLTLVTAGLCSANIKACSYFDPFPCDTRDHLKIRIMCNREIKNYLNFYNNTCSLEDAFNIQDLLDTKGFTEWIKCPVFFVTSLFDDDCPPHMGFSAYNRISAPKSFKIYPELGHLNDKAHGVQMQFLREKLEF